MVKIDQLPNGLTVILEPLPHLESFAYELQLPGGVLLDPDRRVGLSLVTAELTSRGAGGLSSRALSEAFEEYGIRHSEGAGHDRVVYRGLLLAPYVEHALRHVSLMVRQPDFPEQELASIKSVLLQDIASLADDPARRAMVELSQRYYPAPFGRPTHGSEEGIGESTLDDCRALWERSYHPGRAVLSIAGKFDEALVRKIIEAQFGSWEGAGVALPKFGELPAPRAHHIEVESHQLQIVLAFPSAPFGHPRYYAAKMAAGLLSGGMFGRLFIEIREKRGLCYSVFARHSATAEYGTFLAYAGTTPERAKETLEVLLEELRGLAGSIQEEELERARANLLAGLIMGEESTAARAASNGGDWWVSGRVRSLDEIHAAISAVTAADIDALWQEFPPQACTLLTLGSGDAAGVREGVA